MVSRWRDHPHLVSLVTYQTLLAGLAIVAVVLGADEIGGSALLIWVPAAAITAVTWSNLRQVDAVERSPRGASGTGAGEPAEVVA